LLLGDTIDNIPGLPGIGIGKAKKALHGIEGPQEQLQECIRMYQIHSGKEDWGKYMVEQAQLLWIRRFPGQMWGTGFQAALREVPGYDEQELTLY